MKLFVAKLNRDAVESDLLEWFGAMGPVRSVKVVTDRDTGQSKCFGFVEMEDKAGGERAIAEMDGKEFMGFRMVVKEAEERGSRPRSASSGPRTDASRSGQASGGAPRMNSGARPPGAGGSFGADKKPSHKKKKKVQRQNPDKYSDGPRQTKMKKTRGGGGSREWSDFDEEY